MQSLSDRQQQIYELLQTQQRISTQEIRTHFDISPATASRDIHALVLAGLAVKASLGVKLAPPMEQPYQEKKCPYCKGMLKERTVFIIQMEDGSQRSACCCHCGLMALEQAGVRTALACDFLYGRMINAPQAYYLLGSTVNLCCGPTVLAFASEVEAQCFQLGFGGTIHMMEAAIQQLKGLMKL